MPIFHIQYNAFEFTANTNRNRTDLPFTSTFMFFMRKTVT